MLTTLASILELRKNGQHETAKAQLLTLAVEFPLDATVQYETACVHDFLGLERQAIPFYLSAIQNGLSGSALRSAYLGLGSTYRTLGMYAASKTTFLEGLRHFPEASELQVFLAMTRYNLTEYHSAVTTLLTLLVDTTNDSAIQNYARAIREYAKDLEYVWE